MWGVGAGRTGLLCKHTLSARSLLSTRVRDRTRPSAACKEPSEGQLGRHDGRATRSGREGRVRALCCAANGGREPPPPSPPQREQEGDVSWVLRDE